MIPFCSVHRSYWQFPWEQEKWESCIARRMWDAHADLDYPESMQMYKECAT